MALQHTDTSTAFFDGETTFSLICRLLAAMLADSEDRLVVCAKSENFIYAETASRRIVDPVTLRISGAGISENKRGTEFSMKGTIHSRFGSNLVFSLYFFMELNDFLFSRAQTRLARLKGEERMFSIKGSPANLYDALFCLSLKWEAQPDMRNLLREGRGYLIFSQGNPEKSTLKVCGQ